MYRTRKKRSFKWESNWVRRYIRSQADQGKVLDNCCHVISAIGTFCSEDHVIINFYSCYFDKPRSGKPAACKSERKRS